MPTPITISVLTSKVSQPSSPTFKLVEVSIDPTIPSGKDVGVLYKVQNLGKSDGYAYVVLRDEKGNVVTYDVVKVPGSGTRAGCLHFKAPSLSSGNLFTKYTVEVRGSDNTVHDSVEKNVAITTSSTSFFNISVSPTEINATHGSNVSVNVTIGEVGGASGKADIYVFSGDGSQAAYKQVSVSANGESSTSLSFSAPGSKGIYRYIVAAFNDSVKACDDNACVLLDVDNAPIPKLSITGVDAPSSVKPGGTVNVTVHVKNNGNGGTGFFAAIIDQDGNIVASKTGNVSAGATADVSLSFNAPNKSGSYSYTAVVYDDTRGSVDDKYGFQVYVGGNYPRFSIVSVDAPSVVHPGDKFTVKVTVKNSGSAAGDATVELTGPGNLDLKQSVSNLAPGDQASVSFDVTAPSSEGQYTYTVKVINNATGNVDDSKEFTVTVKKSIGPLFKIVKVDAPSQVTVNGTISVSVAIENTGDQSGTVNVIVTDSAGNTVGSKQATIDPGKQAIVDISFNAPGKEGTYTYTVYAKNTATGKVDDSKEFTVKVVKSSEPQFKIVDVNYPSSVAPGAAVTVDVTVENVGGASGSAEVGIVASNGNVLDKKNVSLEPGKQASVSLSFTAPDTPGSYKYTVYAYDNTTGVTDDQRDITITVQKPQQGQPHFKIVNITYPGTVAPGATVTVDVTVANDGSADGSANVEIVDSSGRVVAEKTVSIAAGRQSVVELDFAAPSSEGQYTYTVKVVNNATGNVDASANISVTVSSSAGAGAQTELGPTITILGYQVPVVVLLVALIILALLLR